MGEPLATAQVKDLLEDLLAIPDHQGHEDYKGERGDQELERELGIVIVEGQEQADLVADEPGPDAEDDRIDASELLVVVHDAQPAGDPHHRQSVPEMMEVDSLGGDDLEAREREVEESRTKETAQESQGREE